MRSFTLLILLTFMGLAVLAQSIIEIPYSNTPTIDGIVDASEWQDADTLEIQIPVGSGTVQVLYMHDSVHMNVAFLGNLESVNARFPELMLDVNNDKSSMWMNDDWWFHASGTDCESQGEPDNYDSCQLVRHNWLAVPNITMGAPITDTMEIQIPFSTVGINIDSVDTIGIAFDVSNTFSAWEYWPATANAQNPSTWGNAVFQHPSSTGIEAPFKPEDLSVFPNPNNGSFTLAYPGNTYGKVVDVSVINLVGETVYSSTAAGNFLNKEYQLQLSKGIYLVNVQVDNRASVKRMIVR